MPDKQMLNCAFCRWASPSRNGYERLFYSHWCHQHYLSVADMDDNLLTSSCLSFQNGPRSWEVLEDWYKHDSNQSFMMENKLL